jgi:hypothetical protein
MKLIYCLIAVMLMCCAVQAVPTTLAATLVGNNNATLNGNGVTGSVGWFQWSMKTGVAYAHLPNVTATGGVISYRMKGVPLYGSTQYFYRACDPTGCGAQLSFTTAAVTQLPTPMINGVQIDVFEQNMTENGFDPMNMAWNVMRPYTAVTTETVFYGILFGIVFVSMWLRTRGTQTATIFGMLCLSLFGVSGALLGGGVLPQEFLAVGQGLLYVSLTGAILSWTFK